MAGKVSKADVDYGPGQPHCGMCDHFIDNDEGEGDDEAGTCEIVMGKIREDAWCKLYKSRRQPTLAEGPYE
ncbi:MAG TPA: high-potential iron-sulfur protein [Steroidobacteraceae bacterium]|nr:high-potential iron-sulfur protein [Steroidobacteraceae bacterium]